MGSNQIVGTVKRNQQTNQLSILPRLVNEYSEVTVRGQVVMPRTHVSWIAAYIPNQNRQMKRKEANIKGQETSYNSSKRKDLYILSLF